MKFALRIVCFVAVLAALPIGALRGQAGDDASPPIVADGEDAAVGPEVAAPQSGPVVDDAPVLFASPDASQARADELFRNGVAAWHEGRHARAKELWLEALDALGPSVEPTSGDQLVLDRHALLHDLGNAAFRADAWLEAMGWYRSALRYAPRDAATRHNLELARERAGVLPDTDGPVASAWHAHLTGWTRGEARWLALLGLGPLALALLFEAVRGGRALAWASIGAFLVALACVAPLVSQELRADELPMLVVSSGGVDVRSEARAGANVVGHVEAGDTVERVDALPDWVRVVGPGRTKGWVPESAVFDLLR
ncbi:MAG: SH3 domain-containing protein [Planctomycetota bacterium]